MKPVLLTVDDDPDVLRAIYRDLRRRYGKDYRVMRVESGRAGLETLEQLKERGDAVALLLSDHRMPEMDGVEFLSRTQDLFPDAKRALLTAYADTEAAIAAINRSNLDYYLLKPWDPPDERLYPVLDELLDDWRASFRPGYGGLRVLGNRWSRESHEVKDFLARNHVPYRFLDVELSEEARRMVEQCDLDAAAGSSDAEAGGATAGGATAGGAAAGGAAAGGAAACARLPLVIFPEGKKLVAPTLAELAESLGLRTRAEQPFYDLAIVGAGPAGLASAVYGASEGLRTVLVERQAPGGQAGTSSRIENYLGFPSGLSGSDLARRAVAQARKFGVEILTPQEVEALEIEGPYKRLTFADGKSVSCHALMISSGVAWRRLPAPGAEELAGRGVYYGAAMTEALSCQDEDVYIVGAGNSAGQAAIFFADYARRVVMLLRGEALGAKMSSYLVERIEATEKIEVRYRTQVAECHGEGRLEALTLENGPTGATERVPTHALFIFIGAAPRTDWLGDTIARDKRGFIYTGPDLERLGLLGGWPLARPPFLLEASVPGVFAAGDVRHESIKRVASAVGEGSVAVAFMHRHLASL